MIADAPTEFRTSVLSLPLGGLAGCIGAGVMLVVLALVEPLSGVAPTAFLAALGSRLLGAPAEMGAAAPVLGAGLVLHMLVGALLGVLYASSQQRAPTRGLVTVGVFYGLAIWVGSNLLGELLLGHDVAARVRGWPWALGCIVYGLTLAIVAIWVDRRSAGTAPIVPLD